MISPMLSVRHGASAIKFYAEAFGATELYRIEAESGELVAHLSVGTDTFWLADESPINCNFSPQTLRGSTVRMVMTVEDPDQTFNRAIAAGAKPVYPVSDQQGWRLGRIVDPFGHHWEIGRPLPKAD
jgi:PhnB protein